MTWVVARDMMKVFWSFSRGQRILITYLSILRVMLALWVLYWTTVRVCELHVCSVFVPSPQMLLGMWFCNVPTLFAWICLLTYQRLCGRIPCACFPMSRRAIIASFFVVVFWINYFSIKIWQNGDRSTKENCKCALSGARASECPPRPQRNIQGIWVVH